MLLAVSLGPGARAPTPMQTTGGSPANALKNENGAQFSDPAGVCVTTQAMGRGTIVAVRSLYFSSAPSFSKSKSTSLPVRHALFCDRFATWRLGWRRIVQSYAFAAAAA